MTVGHIVRATWKPLLALAIAAIIYADGSSFLIYSATIVAIYSIAVIGLNILVGLAGQVSFAQTAFMAVGGYALAILSVYLHWDPWVATGLGVLGAGVGAALLGWPLLRLKGHYLTMATFALGMGVFALANGASFMGESIGISAVPPLAIGALSFAAPVPAFVLSIVLCALAIAVFYILKNSPIGRGWLALSVREDAAASIGVPTLRYKVLAFALSAVFGAVSGALYVQLTSYVGPDLYSSTIIVNLFLMLFIGGVQSPYGSLIGSAIVLVLPELISGLSQVEGVVFDSLLLVMILLKPENRDFGPQLFNTWFRPAPRLRASTSGQSDIPAANDRTGS